MFYLQNVASSKSVNSHFRPCTINSCLKVSVKEFKRRLSWSIFFWREKEVFMSFYFGKGNSTLNRVVSVI